jgi:CHAD domain-containing protein
MARLQTAVETERKFGVDHAYAVPDLADLVQVAGERTDTMLTTYYDTADLRLWREGVVLRRRTGGPDAGWHLKLPDEPGGGGDDAVRARLEIQVPLSAGGADGSPPQELLGLVRILLAGATVSPMAQLQTERTRRVLRAPDAAEPVDLAELADDQVVVLHDGVPTASFRELELEHLAGASDGERVLDAVASRLAGAGAQPPAQTSKAVRALGDPADVPPVLPPPPSLDPDAPAADAIQAHLITYTRALRRQDLRVRVDAYDSVHQFRVATRRLRSGLRAFRPLLVPGWDVPLRDDLRWLARSFAPARDTEVMLARLVERAAGLPDDDAAEAVRAFLRRRLGKELDEARETGLAVVAGDRYAGLHEALLAAASDPATTPAARRSCARALPPLAGRAFTRLVKATSKLGPDVSDETWHQARIAAKRARYAAEACAPALGKPAKRLAKELSQITDILGEHQDAVVAAQTLTRLATTSRVPSRTAYWLGVLHEQERAAAHVARAAFEDEWSDVRSSKSTRWLGAG